jgi:uncharacterized membrane protein YfcA
MDWVIIAAAGLLGGMLNAVAGGGSFITLPALIFIGVPPISANATGTAALLPGYIVSAWRFRRDITLPSGMSFISITCIACLGGYLGATILLAMSDRLFSVLIPWLILLATAAFVIGPWLLRKKISSFESQRQQGRVSSCRQFLIGLTLFVICVYGGYFNGGLGIILLSALGLMGFSSLHGMNGVKNIISALLTAVSVVVYSLGDAIALREFLLLGVMAAVGGYLGSVLSYRLPPAMLRGFIIVVGCVLSTVFFIQQSV